MKKQISTIIFLKAIIVLTIVLSCKTVNAQKGHHIEFEIKNYPHKKMILAYYLGDKQYIKDTLITKESGKFETKSDKELSPGMYAAYFPKINKYVDFLINKKEQHFKLTTNTENLIGSMQVENSPENKQFYESLNFLSKQRENRSKIKNEVDQLKQKSINKSKINELEAEINKIDDLVVAYKKDIIAKKPNSFTARIIEINKPVHIPKEIGDNDHKRYYYYKEHFFDNVHFDDERFLRTQFLNQKIDKYLDISIQDPNSIIVAVDKILNLTKSNDEIYKFFLIKLVNKYAKSKIICMDAVYVHLVDNYYSKGKAYWIEKNQLQKMQNNAALLRPLLCGKVVPDIVLQTISKPVETKSLHKINANYIVLFMWNPDYKNIKKPIQEIVKVYNKFKSKGVKVFSICTKSNYNQDELLKFIDENNMNLMINLIDWNNKSNYKQIFDFNDSNTYSIYILDKNKKILIKKIGADQITDVLNNSMERDENN